MIGSLAEGVLAVGPDGDRRRVANDAANRYLGLPEGAESARARRACRRRSSTPCWRRARPDAGPADRRQVVAAGRRRAGAARRPAAPTADAGVVVTLRDVTERAPAGACPARPGGQRLPRAQDADRRPQGVPRAAGGRGRRASATAASSSRSMTQETARLERLVEEQLQLARLDAGALPLGARAGRPGRAGAEVVAPARAPGRAGRGVASARGRPAGAGRGRGRPRARRADPADPARQRAAPHAGRRPGARSSWAATARTATVAVRRHRRGHPARGPALRLRPLLPRRPLARGPRRRPRPGHRARPGRRPTAGRSTWTRRPGEGSTFTLRLPLSAARGAATPAIPPPHPRWSTVAFRA